MKNIHFTDLSPASFSAVEEKEDNSSSRTEDRKVENVTYPELTDVKEEIFPSGNGSPDPEIERIIVFLSHKICS